MKFIPKLREGKFEFLTLKSYIMPSDAQAAIIEDEGMTVVVPTDRDDADAFAWISLAQKTSLAVTGITKAFSTALSDAGIPCNVLAAYFHDHLLVPYDKRDEAMKIISEVVVSKQDAKI